MKGACDGGMDIPHNTKRFPGAEKTADTESYDAAVHRDRIFGKHVDTYMETLKKESKEDYLK
jgi:large subunit ribosomal protein L5e